MINHYSAPDKFNFDFLADDEPFEDNLAISTYNAKVRGEEFWAYVQKYAKTYRTNHIMVVMGDDFQYANARMNFMNMDNLIRHMKSTYADKMDIFYDTPGGYVDALSKLNVSWPTKYDDGFPYADNEKSYWTGYFTSHANDKGFIRTISSSMHASTKLYALKAVDQKTTTEMIG